METNYSAQQVIEMMKVYGTFRHSKGAQEGYTEGRLIYGINEELLRARSTVVARQEFEEAVPENIRRELGEVVNLSMIDRHLTP